MLAAHILLAAVFFPLHELPDGRAEVGLDAIIRGDKIEITYSVAMSDGTMISLEPELKAEHESNKKNVDLVRKFGSLALPKIGKSIELTIDGERLELKPVDWEVSARHPVRFICHYEASLNGKTLDDEQTKIRIEDKNYRDFEKQSAMSCRAKGDADLIDCDAAPILVRAERVRLWELELANREKSQTIEAVVRLPKSDGVNLQFKGESAEGKFEGNVERPDTVDDSTDKSAAPLSNADQQQSIELSLDDIHDTDASTRDDRQIDTTSPVKARILTAVLFALFVAITVFRLWRRVG